MAKTYDICGLGNALIDLEYKVSDHFLEKLDIEKGFMALVDAKQQAALLEALDSKPIHQASGGSAANTIAAAQALGAKCYYNFKVASDRRGHDYLNGLDHMGVDYRQKDGHLPTGVTGSCVVLVTPDGQRSMKTFLGISQSLSTHDLSESAIAQSKYLYIEGYLVTSDNSFEAAQQAIAWAKKHDTKVALTFSDPSMATYFKPQLNTLLDLKPDLLFANLEELMSMTDAENFEQGLELLSTKSDELVVTLSEKGAVVVLDGETLKIQGYPVIPVDTNGAGDLFAGAYLSSRINNHTPQASAQLANFLASQLVTRSGPRLPFESHVQLASVFFDEKKLRPS
jgi:sugar/nucleoside kinase (ribokinase family)